MEIAYRVAALFAAALTDSIALHIATAKYLSLPGERSAPLLDFFDFLPDYGIPTWTLDGAILVPACLYVWSLVHADDRRAHSVSLLSLLTVIWTLKGLFAVSTIIPDSMGRDGCEDRLGSGGVRDLSREDDLLPMLWSVIELTFRKPTLRYCADMFYSGHTATALSLSLCSAPVLTRRLGPRMSAAVVAGVTAPMIALIILRKFHYTIDVLGGVVITTLTWACLEPRERKDDAVFRQANSSDAYESGGSE